MMKDAGMDEYLNEWNVLVFPSVEKSYQYQYAWCLGPSLRSGTNTSTGTTVPVVLISTTIAISCL
jgi:hypothetical protein